MATFTEAEERSYADMQARLVALLLRHDDRWFRRFFAVRPDFESELASDTLRRYREFGVLFHLRDELFEHILPRIVRRLSFESPRSTVIEEPPGRGRVDWERTLDATWSDRPGETPLLLHTRQRRRDFATSENLLAVITLLEYRAAVQRLLWDEYEAIGAASLRHPLHEIVERCDRELRFPQFAGLITTAQAILDGHNGGTETLEMQVQQQLAPGGNSAYEELLLWRTKWRTLELLRRVTAADREDVLGADPDRDNYLYQLWIFFEIADLLTVQERVIMLDTRPGTMRMEFRWGKGEDMRIYELRHDQKVPTPVASWKVQTGKAIVPGVRPDFYIRRLDPPSQRIEYRGRLYWREPGVVLDAKYYRERESTSAPSSPIKRMIADLQLLGEQWGVLLFAFLQEQSQAVKPTQAGEVNADDELEPANAAQYALAPDPGHDQTLAGEQEVSVRRLRPVVELNNATRGTFFKLLTDVDRWLASPRIPACYGIFADTMSAAAIWDHTKSTLDRYGREIPNDSSELLLCPKPHIGSWRVDLVSRVKHCCQDPFLCQIIGQPGSHKPIRPPRKAEDLVKELHRLLEGQEERDAAEIAVIAHEVERLTRNLAEVTGAMQRIDIYYQRLRDLGMQNTLQLLGKQEQESLALAIFLVEQLDLVGASDYSAPAIQIARVVEGEVVDKVFKSCPDLVGRLERPRDRTLGSLPAIALYPDKSEGNWQRVQAYAAQYWQGQIDPDRPDVAIAFADFAKALEPIRVRRNEAAHPHPFTRTKYTELQTMTCQSGLLGYGTLNVLLLAWRE